MSQAQFSSKGQIVIPKDIRDRHAFVPGQTVDVIETPAGVLLRLPKPKSTETFEEITARIRERAKRHYNGPPVSIEDMNTAIAEMWAKGGPSWDK